MKSKIRKTRILGFGGIALTVIIIWLMVLSPRASKPAALDLLKTQAYAQKVTLEKQAIALNSARSQIPAAEKRLKALSLEFPKAADATGFEAEINSLANKVGISSGNIMAVTLSQPTLEASGDSADIAVSISISGTYAQLSQFVNSLYNATRGIAITSVAFSANSTATNKTNSYLLSLSGTTYLLQQVAAVPPTLLK